MSRKAAKKEKRNILYPALIILVILAVIIAIVCLVSALIRGSGGGGAGTGKRSYPVEYSEQIEKYAAEYGVPPEVIYGIVYAESRFDTYAVSSAGAVGLMQLMPDTFHDMQNRLGESLTDYMLTEPDTNIRYGAYYLRYLYDIFGEWNTVYAAYNAGMGNVRRWLADPQYSEDGKTLAEIPYSETKAYVSKVEKAVGYYSEYLKEKEESN